MNDSFRHSFLPNSAISLANSIIRHFYARREEDNAEFPEMYDTYRELFNYPWTLTTINLLKQLVEARPLHSDFYRTQYEAFFRLIGQGDGDLFYLLFKYSFLNLKTLEDYPVIKYNVTEEERSVMVCWKYSREYRYGPKNNSFRIYEPFYHFCLLRKLMNFTCVSPTRLRNALWGLDAITENFPSPSVYKVRCLKTFYEFARVPYITSSEIVDIAKYIGGRNISDFTLGQIRMIFEKYFPKSKQDYQPRSLQHLCFCKIRENLKSVGRLPNGVQQLPIPDRLKKIVVPEKPCIDFMEGMPLLEFDERTSFVLIYEETVTRFERYSVYNQWWK